MLVVSHQSTQHAAPASRRPRLGGGGVSVGLVLLVRRGFLGRLSLEEGPLRSGQRRRVGRALRRDPPEVRVQRDRNPHGGRPMIDAGLCAHLAPAYGGGEVVHAAVDLLLTGLQLDEEHIAFSWFEGPAEGRAGLGEWEVTRGASWRKAGGASHRRDPGGGP